MFPSSRFRTTAPAHTLSVPTGMLKMNAHIETRLDPLTGPYVESCKRRGIFPVHLIRSKLADSGVKQNLANRGMEIKGERNLLRVHRQVSPALGKQRRL